MRRVIIAIALVLHTICVWSQTFRCEAKLPSVDQDGFYKIYVTPEAAVHLNTSFTNIRIYDQDSEVPYLIQEERPKSISQEFKDYKILEKQQRQGCCTSLILHNPDRNPVNSINLVIKNADITKEAVLLGSDDQKHWYALKQRFVLYPTSSNSGTSYIRIVDFPLSNYIYFSLQINDSTSAPLNILAAGYFESVTRTGKYSEVPVRKIIVMDSLKQKKTYVHFQFDTVRIIDFFEVAMKGPAFFQRKAFLYLRKERALRTGTVESYYDLIQEVELSSKRPAGIELPGIKVGGLLMAVENEDNPALEIDYSKAYQLNRYLVAFLNKEKQYVIKIGEEALQAPVYDLPFFIDHIPATAPILTIGEFNVLEKRKSEPNFTFFTTKAFIWAAVVFVIVILGFMSVRLLKDLNSSGNK